MAPTTRRMARASTPECETKAKEHDTPCKTNFFKDYDRDHATTPLTRIAAANKTFARQARRWLDDRRENGDQACRRTRKRSKILGAKSKVSKTKCRELVSTRNPVRDQLLEHQIQYHDLPLKKRALITQIKENTKNGRRYKMAYVRKRLSKTNKDKRLAYGQEHKRKTVKDYWHLYHFTDETHIDPSLMKTGWILREEGTRLNPDNIQEKPKKGGVQLHIAGWVNWYKKCDKLEFYHDEEDKTVQPKRPRKPVKRKKESEEEFGARIKEWEATKPHEREVKVKGNSMTQKYYVERLLPIYIDAIRDASERQDLPWILQEDNNKSHGH